MLFRSVVWEKGFLGVVADKEWDATKAAQALKVEWSDAKPPFPDQAALYDRIRSAQVRKREIGGKQAGNVDEAFKAAARVVEAEYEWPFRSHACMGPACAVVEVKDGDVTCRNAAAAGAGGCQCELARMRLCTPPRSAGRRLSRGPGCNDNARNSQ